MGDDERFRRLYDEHAHRILGYALRRTADPEDAADVVAEVFLVAWRRLADVPAGDEARLWLYAVARGVVANQWRGERRRARLSVRVSRLFGPLFEAPRPPGADADRSAIVEAFGALPDRDREVLALVGWEGLDRDEVAVVLGCSRAAVRVRLHRARARFERELALRDVDVAQRGGTAGHEWFVSAAVDTDRKEAR